MNDVVLEVFRFVKDEKLAVPELSVVDEEDEFQFILNWPTWWSADGTRISVEVYEDGSAYCWITRNAAMLYEGEDWRRGLKTFCPPFEVAYQRRGEELDDLSGF